ncbi:uncharacterized protein LOC117104997 [Anneissia japonica]|uniref:uncharacterized protein LOC117104997 n=1 Tax=Anneissia japonica TaxID=1529436 RepID=UPI0014259C58|nr:uncharacterized protein LOC117104997 [Anneissia japonica]
MANKCSGASAVVSLAFLTIFCVTCVSSEIVGGHVYWKQIINKKIKIMYRLQWEGGSDKNDYTGKGTKRQEGDIYICDVKTSKKVALLKFQNLAYNPYRKWTVGRGTTNLSLEAKAFQFYLAERCMSPFLRLKEPQTSKWSIYISGNLTSQSGNKSPVSYMNPVVPFRKGCYHNIEIPSRFMSRQQCIEIDVYSGDLTNLDVVLAPPAKENNFKMKINFSFEVKLPSKEGVFMVLVGKTLKNLRRELAKMMNENYKDFNKKFKVYDLAKQSTPISVSADDKNSFILDLDSFLGNEAISKRTRFFVYVTYNLWSVIKYPPCKEFSGLNDGNAYLCVFDGKSALCNPDLA